MTDRPFGQPAFVTTGIAGLDAIIGGFRIGDNVVWRTTGIDDYRLFVEAFAAAARRDGRRVIYVRFARHERLLEDALVSHVERLDAFEGFEPFTARLHTLIAREGNGVFYVFDCLSDLLDAWATDRMIASFFRVTCPYLFELETVACFALDRAAHSLSTVDAIRATTQVLLDLYGEDGTRYLHPLKVWQRSSPTMFLPHSEQDGRFTPITVSSEATDLLRRLPGAGAVGAERQLDFWARLFLRASAIAADPSRAAERVAMVDQICRLIIGRDDRILALARRFLSLEDLLAIERRMISTGFIGGKAAGMLIARAILESDRGGGWSERLESHDSYFIGSDLFHACIVHNGWWPLLMEQRAEPGYGTAAARLHERLREAAFPEDVRHEFRQMLEHFGQYPIIVRSSSLLEDGFGNAFAGKYDSVFCVSRGSPEHRLSDFLDALRTVYASTVSEDALEYRRQRRLATHDEQMAVLVQRVSGAYAGSLFFPPFAGVGFSRNTCAWHPDITTDAGVLRLVIGLGTRAVDRVGTDYPRLVALDRPLLQPQSDNDGRRRHAQHDVDVLDVDGHGWRSLPVAALESHPPTFPLELLADRHEHGWLVTFDRLLAETGLADTFRGLLGTLERAYEYPVDVEFTGTWDSSGRLRLNLIQCRPLQTRGIQSTRVQIADTPDDRTLFRSRGNFMGGSIVQPIGRIVEIDSSAFSALPLSDKYEVARLVGRINRTIVKRDGTPTLLMAPGRLGTSTPQLGLPVRFAEINGFVAIAELAFAAGGQHPELSFGSHFFQDLVETGIFYVALDAIQPGCFLSPSVLRPFPNRLAEWMPDDARLAGVVRITELAPEWRLLADIVTQRTACVAGPF